MQKKTSGLGFALAICQARLSKQCASAEEFVLQSPVFPKDDNTGYISFLYHMYGTGMGSLWLQAWVGGTWTTVWSKSGNQGETWHFAAAALDKNARVLRFLGMTGGGKSDMALDAIKWSEDESDATLPRIYLRSGPCEVDGFCLQNPSFPELGPADLECEFTSSAPMHTTHFEAAVPAFGSVLMYRSDGEGEEHSGLPGPQAYPPVGNEAPAFLICGLFAIMLADLCGSLSLFR